MEGKTCCMAQLATQTFAAFSAKDEQIDVKNIKYYRIHVMLLIKTTNQLTYCV